MRLIVRRLRDAGLARPVVQRPYRNVVATIPGAEPGSVIAGAHYDTKDVPGFVGANDGASGVAVLLELARDLPRRLPGPSLRLAFFDAEESAGRPAARWRSRRRATEGASSSSAMRAAAASRGRRRLGEVRAMVLFDMVGDCDLRIPLEENSDPSLYRLFAAASAIGRPVRRRGYGHARRPHAVRRCRDPRGRPDRLRLRPRAHPRRLVAHAVATTWATSALRASGRWALPRSPRFPRSAERAPAPGAAATLCGDGADHRRPCQGRAQARPAGRPARLLRGCRPRRAGGRGGARPARAAGLRAQGDRPQQARRRAARRAGGDLRRQETEVPEGELVVFSAHGVAPERPRERRGPRACGRSMRPAPWSPRSTSRRGSSPSRATRSS